VFERLYRWIPSGLYVTTFLDSHYNILKVLCCLDEMGIDINTIHIRVQGDDSICALRIYIPSNQHEIFKSRLADIAKRRFDSDLSVDKSAISTTPQGMPVLGYENNNGYPERDWRKLLATLLHPRSVRPQIPTLMTQCIGLIYASIYQRNVVNVCTDIFNYCASLGFSPSQTLPENFFLIEDVEIDLSRLPTQLEVTRFLRNPPSQRPVPSQEFWNSDFFLATH